MTAYGEVLIGLVMVVGIVGVVVPVLPGLLLVWGAALAWVLLDGGGGVRWTVLAVVSALLVVATVAKFAVPARSATAAGAPRSTLALAAVGAVLGMFVIPVLGILVGGVGAIFLAEWRRLGDAASAWRSTRAVLVSIGIGVLIELVGGLLMVLTWAIGVIST